MLQYDAISFEKEFPKTILGSSNLKIRILYGIL